MNENNKSSFFTALVGNILPLLGVLFFNWSVTSILLAYWLENVVIGVYQVLKMRRSKVNFPHNEKNKLVVGPLRPILSSEKVFYPIFFCVHYGLFLLVHLFFLWFFGQTIKDEVLFAWPVVVSALPFLITHGRVYVSEYVEKKQYEQIPMAKLFIAPYRRIFIMHATLIIGSIPLFFLLPVIPKIGAVLVFLKVILDVVLKEKEFDFWKKLEEKGKI